MPTKGVIVGCWPNELGAADRDFLQMAMFGRIRQK